MTSSKGRGHHLKRFSLNCHTGRAMSLYLLSRSSLSLRFFKHLSIFAPRPWLVSERIAFVRSTAARLRWSRRGWGNYICVPVG